jgi:hypothetical protein
LVLLAFDLVLLSLDLLLLFLKGIDEGDAQAVVLHAFDLAFVVVGDQQRLDCCDVFRRKPQISLARLLPVESDGPQLVYQLKP